MEIYLMQHGDALSKDVDPNRSLSREGMEQVRIAGRALACLGVRPERLISSPKTRARQTAQVVAEALEFSGEVAVVEALEPLTPPEETIEAIQKGGEMSSVFLTGHLPSLAELAAHLIGSQGRIAFRMAGVGCFHAENWKRGAATLLWYLTPEQLRLISK